MAAHKATPGILYVTMQPKEGLPLSQFHDWYNNEHGPGRLRLSFCQNGFRYRANDLSSDGGNGQGSAEKPEWMAIYDIDDMDYLTQDAPVQSQRERDTMKQIHVDRKFYDFVKEWKPDGFKKLEEVQNEGEKNVMVAVLFSVREGQEEELRKWYEEEHVALLQKVPGWRRTRRFQTSYLDIQDGRPMEFLALHEYAPENGLGGPEFVAAISTPWSKKIYEEVITGRKRRTYDMYYTFGPAPRDLEALTSGDTLLAESTDGLTKTFPAAKSDTKRPVIHSFITTKDGVQLPYHLEGSSDPNAPLLVLANSILVDYGIWDDFVNSFLSNPTTSHYRVLRYSKRGRSALPSSTVSPITVDTLASDVITILDALRVKKAAIAGVSLGGATALNTALTYPDRITAFVACDTNSLAPPGNPKAWGERIEMAEREGAKSEADEPIVGQELAEITVRRWFVKESYESAELQPKIERVKQMVATNSLPGFRDSVKALYQYDFRPRMADYSGKGAFLVGAGDGVLPKTMKDMADSLGKGVHLEVIDQAGHLPMVEQPEKVAAFLSKFLEG
ncbi:alpha/beta-hydrolase [Corynespora cassiicola Philippines]|uniref:Alpha/beta-hydrolase n=1 Tax=Corynespora cassiicola Philippines TaxID=1448308 RepID=A0A2T2P4L2_CORCC|nr:alpha/beta-hydrolase [Corynespora cassiicola Philippines]